MTIYEIKQATMETAHMNIGDSVKTKLYGNGIIENIEVYSRLGGAKRYGLKLDNNPFCCNIPYFWEEEIIT